MKKLYSVKQFRYEITPLNLNNPKLAGLFRNIRKLQPLANNVSFEEAKSICRKNRDSFIFPAFKDQYELKVVTLN